jgi:hypothetical protein
MAGGAMAIVFTISVFLLQNASDLYSSQYFEVYIHDWREKVVYFAVIIITIILFGAGIYLGCLDVISQQIASWFIVTSLGFIGAVFALIDWQYKSVRQKINPSKAIEFLEKEGARFLNRLQSDAKKLARIMQVNDQNQPVTEELALAAAYNRFLPPFISNLDRQLENLVEISMKLADKHEVGTTKRGFTAVYRILERFFEARKTSSLAIPAGDVFLALQSDSQTFLSANLERLNKAGEKFIKEGKDEIATYIIDVYRALAIKAQEISFIRQKNENPILENIIGYLGFFIDNGQRAKNIEVVFQGSRVLSDISIIAANKGLGATLNGIQEKILKIAIFGLSEKQNVIVDSCNVAFLRIIGAIFNSDKIIRRYHFTDSLKNIATISSYISTFIGAGLLPNDITNRFSLSKGYDQFYMTLAGVMNKYSQIIDSEEKSRYRGDLVEFFHELNRSLRKLSEDVKSCDTNLTDSVGRLIFNINELIIDMMQSDDFREEKDKLMDRLEWNIHLPYWFTHHADKFDAGSMHLYTLTDSVAKTGILSAEKLNNKDLLISSISSISSMAEQAIQKGAEGYGYSEPRIMEKACYLGVLALKRGWMDAVIELAIKIYDFEKKYVVKYFSNIPTGIDVDRLSPGKEQLLDELLKWRREFDYERLNGVRMRDDAKAMMYSLVERTDVDKFIFEVWRVLTPGSELDLEIEEKAKKAKIKRLTGILNNRISAISKPVPATV